MHSDVLFRYLPAEDEEADEEEGELMPSNGRKIVSKKTTVNKKKVTK